MAGERKACVPIKTIYDIHSKKSVAKEGETEYADDKNIPCSRERSILHRML